MRIDRKAIICLNGFFVEIDDPRILVDQLINNIRKSSAKVQEIKANCYKDKQFLPAAFKNHMNAFMDKVLR